MLTREHVIPSFLYSYQRKFEQVIGWNDNVQKMLRGDQVIGDVCGECNSGALSQLDQYAQKFFTTNGILTQNFTATTLDLHYDYDQLLRFNLKVSFNSARRTGAESHLFEPFVPYMLGQASSPGKNQIRLVVQLLKGHRFVGEDAMKLIGLRYADDAGLANPFIVRISRGVDIGGRYPQTNVRINIFGAVMISMLIFGSGLQAGRTAEICRRYISDHPESTNLRAERRLAVLRQGPKTWLEEYSAQIHRARSIA